MLSGNVAWIKGKNNTAKIALFIARILKAKLNALQHFQRLQCRVESRYLEFTEGVKVFTIAIVN